MLFKEETKAIIECLLFVSNKPLELKTMSKVICISEDDISKLLLEIKEELNQKNRGLQLLESESGFQLVTKPQYYNYIKKLYKPSFAALSQAATETLAIVAYKQPITRMELEAIRGVKSDSVLTTLQEKDLIKVLGKKEVPGNPVLYGTTNKFLSSFGLNSLEELPSLEEVNKIFT